MLFLHGTGSILSHSRMHKADGWWRQRPLAPVLGAANAEIGWVFLLTHPIEVSGHFWIRPYLFYGMELLSQRCFGKQGVQLMVAGGAQLNFWA